MATPHARIRVPRAAAAIRDALNEHAPDLVERFESEFRAAAELYRVSLRSAGLDEVLHCWRAQAEFAANPLSAEDKALVDRVDHGDNTGLVDWEDLRREFPE
ncbi:DUF6247 family protein [Streptoalloteichus hindustanus]|uniref:Uncharacterized protein n=1 Tax=Streptoalloteichus hindustanus TaxID=2017 RepID=A0A1M5PD94_STRHI|nr:DUF6247 family protein [Streptoalloteichus hindustanus]SHG99725.1 hypothetical protein SAMN05444320_11817 [Streptoalloteichus hindustanus]